MAWQPIQAAYRVSILTFISCTEKEKGPGPRPYFRAIIDIFCRIPLNHYFRPFRALSATELLAFQPLTITIHERFF